MRRRVFRGAHGARRTFGKRAGIGRIVLNGGRCAAGAEKRGLVECSRKNGARIVPSGNLRSGGNSAEGDRQRRSMQRLANMANRLRSAVMLVYKAAAARKVEQRQT